MNSLTKWESVILKNEFNSKYSKFFVTYDFFRKIAKELDRKSQLSKIRINKLISDNNNIISSSINDIEKDIKKILLPLSGYLEKNFHNYLKSYRKHYKELSREERLSSLKPKYFYKIAKPLFKQRYDNVIDAIGTSLHDFEDIILSECENITSSFFDSLDSIYVFGKSIDGSLDVLNKNFISLSKQSKSVLYGFINEFKSDELNSDKLNEITDMLLDSRNSFLESWISFKKEVKASFLKSSQNLMFGVIESGDLINKKHEIIDNIKVWFPDIKEVISNRINIITEKISLIDEKVKYIIPADELEELKQKFVMDLERSKNVSSDIIDYSLEYIRKQFTEVLDIIDKQSDSLNLLYAFLNSMRKNYFDKISIVDSSLRSILSTYIGISNRLENKIEFTTIIEDYVSDLNSEYPEKNKMKIWKERWLKWK